MLRPDVGPGGQHPDRRRGPPRPRPGAGRARSSSSRSGVALRPITKNGSRPRTRAMSRVSPAYSAGDQADGHDGDDDAGPTSGGTIGVSSRQKNSAERYHIGQCGSWKRSLELLAADVDPEERRGRTRRSRRAPRRCGRAATAAPGVGEGAREVAGDEDERRHVPGVEEVVEVVGDRVVREQRPASGRRRRGGPAPSWRCRTRGREPRRGDGPARASRSGSARLPGPTRRSVGVQSSTRPIRRYSAA